MYLKSIFNKNGYPTSLVDFCINGFLNKLHRSKDIVSNVPKKEILIVLPFLGTSSLKIRSRLREFFRNKFPAWELRMIFKAEVRLSSFFRFKDAIPKYLQSGLVYRFKCGGCNTTYYGKTKRHFKVRICEHLGVSHLTNKLLSNKQNTAISEHLSSCDFSPTFDSFDILTKESNDFKLTMKESLLIERDKPFLNKTVKSAPLELF